MKLHPQLSLSFNGQCEAAFRRYAQCLSGTIAFMLTWGDSPNAADAPSGWEAKIYHATLKVGDTAIMGSDVPPDRYDQAKGFEVVLQMDDPVAAERVFQQLAEGGTIRMPLQETFWASRFGVLIDRFGIPWSVNCERAGEEASDVSTDAESNVNVVIEPALPTDLGAVVDLLKTGDLPVEDVGQHLSAFVLARWQGVLVGVVGLEHHGDMALLRSLCVAGSHRGRRVGRALLSAIETVAATQGVRDLYLLTTGAAPYFERQGFAAVSREHAPTEIQGTEQFRSLCPSSAICMHKPLPLGARHVSAGTSGDHGRW